MPVFTNLSQMAREIDYMGKAVFKETGDALAAMIWEEFDTLVKETAQWTGTAAASWNLSMGGDHSVRERPEIKDRQQALEKGHQDAVEIALGHNYGALDDISVQYRYKAIVVENYAESIERAESGPLRDVNSPAGAFMRFQERVANRSFEIIRNRTL